MKGSRLRISLSRVQLSRGHRLALAIAAVLAMAAGVAVWRRLHPLPKLRDIERWANAAQWERAEAAATEYVARRPRDPDGLMLAARVAAARGEMARCVSLLERVPSDSPIKIEALLRQAQALQALGYGQRQERAWLELIRAAERHAGKESAQCLRAQEELVALYFLERRAAEAKALVWEMYPRHREKWRLLIALARIEGKPARASLATPALERFVAVDAEDLPAHRALATYALDDRPDDALALARHCMNLAPDDGASLEVLIEAHLRLNLWHEIDSILSRDDLPAERPHLWRLRGQWHLQQGRLVEAVAALREALRLNPFDQTTQYQLGQALRRGTTIEAAQQQILQSNELRGHQDAIATYLNSFVSDDPQTWETPPPEKCVELSDHCRGLGRRDEALGWLDEALRRQPDFAPARDALDELNRSEQSP